MKCRPFYLTRDFTAIVIVAVYIPRVQTLKTRFVNCTAPSANHKLITPDSLYCDDISDHYLVLCKLHIAKDVNSTPSYKYGRTITSTTKDCFVTIGEEELYKLVKSAKPTTCMLDPIPYKLLKDVLPEVIDPLLAIINLSMSLGYVPKTFKLAVIKPLIKKHNLTSNI